MTPQSIVSEIYQSAVELPEPYESLSDDEKDLAERLLKKFDKAEKKHGPLPQREIVRPMLLSKSGRHGEALDEAEQQYRSTPSWATAVAVANSARRAGDLERAVEMFEAGAGHDPKDVTCLLEIGDIRLEQERFDEALASYEKVLAKEAEHAWAQPSAIYCRYRLGIEGTWLASLREIATQEGCTCGLQGCLSAMFGGYGSDRAIARAEYLLGKVAGETAAYFDDQ